ncbi:MAG TPA: hypothetical protein VGR70_21020 [Stellaceae bacterium]|nr:hypothetical protein [Stellaceae bacterium]
MDPLKIIGVILVVLVIAIAGYASFGVPGLVIGLLIGLSIAFGLVNLLRNPMSEGRAFDPAQTRRMISDPRYRFDRQSRRRA